ncbi:spore gernimation protein [Paenibacillus selenitireducens]|uniref:Spore gernimation protein n=1 Tax=Paenibacillus selenitireducens TaxID=1324314 RepID=A0A1T2XDT6_9BACL|nr:endospore germination permease [Paenibacillus selenitireducens]OPA77773.1 spore gernimation protein [Paenibacillus selenitireducens]
MKAGTKSITFFQACMILILSTGLLNHVNIIPLLLQCTGNDGWMSILLVLCIALLWIPTLLYVLNRKGTRPIYLWLKEQSGSFIAWVIVGILILYLFSIAFVTLKDTTNWTMTSYLTRTPVFMLASILTLLCSLSALAGIRSIAICAGALLPIVIILGYFVMGLNFQYKDYSLITPLFENGFYPILKGIVYPGAGMVELFMFLLLQHHLSTKVSYKGLAILAICLAGLTIGPYLGSIANFGREIATDLRFPVFEQWRLVTIGKYINHLDFLSIYQWLSGAFIRISLAIFFVYDLTPIRGKRPKFIFCVSVSIALILAVQFSMSDMLFMKWLYTLYYPTITISIIVLSFIMCLLTWIHQANRRIKSHDQPSN